MSELKKTNGSIDGSLKNVNARAFEAKRDQKKTCETIAVTNSCVKTLTEMISTPIEE